MNSAIHQMDVTELLQEREHSFAISSAVHAALKRAVREALSSPEVYSLIVQSFSSYLTALAPTEAVGAMMREFEARQVSVEEFMGRFPRYVGFIAQAWSQAIKDTTELLARGS